MGYKDQVTIHGEFSGGFYPWIEGVILSRERYYNVIRRPALTFKYLHYHMLHH